MESWGVSGEKLERAHVVLSTHCLNGAVTPAGATVLVFVGTIHNAAPASGSETMRQG